MFIISKLYEKIIKDIEEGIEKGVYTVGKKIPSVRELSKKYNCSINTVIKAYDTLKNNHVIYASPKSGYYIVENINKINISTSDTINFYSGNTLIGDMNIQRAVYRRRPVRHGVPDRIGMRVAGRLPSQHHDA